MSFVSSTRTLCCLMTGRKKMDCPCTGQFREASKKYAISLALHFHLSEFEGDERLRCSVHETGLPAFSDTQNLPGLTFRTPTGIHACQNAATVPESPTGSNKEMAAVLLWFRDSAASAGHVLTCEANTRSSDVVLQVCRKAQTVSRRNPHSFPTAPRGSSGGEPREWG